LLPPGTYELADANGGRDGTVVTLAAGEERRVAFAGVRAMGEVCLMPRLPCGRAPLASVVKVVSPKQAACLISTHNPQITIHAELGEVQLEVWAYGTQRVRVQTTARQPVEPSAESPLLVALPYAK
jgi:hypothetical protein